MEIRRYFIFHCSLFQSHTRQTLLFVQVGKIFIGMYQYVFMICMCSTQKSTTEDNIRVGRFYCSIRVSEVCYPFCKNRGAVASWLKCTQLWIKGLQFEPWVGTLCCNLMGNTLLSQNLLPPRCTNGY